MPQISLEEHRSRGAQNVRRAQKTPSQVGILIKSERDSVIARYVPPGKEVKWSKLKHLSKKTLLWDRSHNLLLALVVQYSHGCYYRYPCCRFINFQSSVPVCHAGDAVKILKFSDDTKLFFLQKLRISEKNNNCKMTLKIGQKVKILLSIFCDYVNAYTGHGNTIMNYEMGGTILRKTVPDKDLGVTMNANMKVSELCIIAASKGNQVRGMISRNITYNKEKGFSVPWIKQ